MFLGFAFFDKHDKQREKHGERESVIRERHQKERDSGLRRGRGERGFAEKEEGVKTRSTHDACSLLKKLSLSLSLSSRICGCLALERCSRLPSRRLSPPLRRPAQPGHRRGASRQLLRRITNSDDDDDEFTRRTRHCRPSWSAMPIGGHHSSAPRPPTTSTRSPSKGSPRAGAASATKRSAPSPPLWRPLSARSAATSPGAPARLPSSRPRTPRAARGGRARPGTGSGSRPAFATPTGSERSWDSMAMIS